MYNTLTAIMCLHWLPSCASIDCHHVHPFHLLHYYSSYSLNLLTLSLGILDCHHMQIHIVEFSPFFMPLFSQFLLKFNSNVEILISSLQSFKKKNPELCPFFYFMVKKYHSKKSLKIPKGGNQNPYIKEEQTTQWPKEKVQKDKQRSTKHTYKTKDRVTLGSLRIRRYNSFRKWPTHIFLFQVSQFHNDIFPPTASLLPSLTADEWISGQNREPVLVSMLVRLSPLYVFVYTYYFSHIPLLWR